MLTITDIRVLGKNRFDFKYEKLMMILGGIFIAWVLVALISQSFVSMDRTFVYPVPDSVVKMTGNEVSISSFGRMTFNDYVLPYDDDSKRSNLVFLGLGIGAPFLIVMVLLCVYIYKKDRYVMAFQQKWLETGLVPDTDKI